MDPIRMMLLGGLVALAFGCHTYEGAKQDAKEAGTAVEKGVRRAGEATGRAVERSGTAIEDTFKK
jgi:predicted small secreted protein